MYKTNPKRQNPAHAKKAILFGYKGFKCYLYDERKPVVFRPSPLLPEGDNCVMNMKKYLLLLLLGVFLCACTSDEGEGIPFVTDVEMPSEARTFAPGDEVTVAAKGFEADDDIMLRITWPLTNAAISEGYADGIWGVVKSRTESSITFLAPGGYPAGTVEVKLFRRGKAMPLGKISVSDGTPPAAYALYGITNSLIGEVYIDKMDLKTGETVRTAQFAGGVFTHPVNRPGSNCIFGLSLGGGKRSAAFYDLTMRYFKDSGSDRIVTTGVLPNSETAYLMCEDNHCIILGMTETRTSVVVPPSWRMPVGIDAAMLMKYPFVMNGDGYVMLSVNNAEGVYTPMAFGMRSEGAEARLGDPVWADEMIPFWIVESASNAAGAKYSISCGYAVVRDGATEFRLYDPAAMSFGDVLASVPAAVRSVTAVTFPDSEIQDRIYMLCDSDEGGSRILVYDRAANSLEAFSGSVHCTEIVLVR